MMLLQGLLLLLLTAATATSTPQTLDEAEKIVANYVNSLGCNVTSLCEGRKCCTVSDTEACAITDMDRDQSVLVIPGGETRCIVSDSTPFAFQVRDNQLFSSILHFSYFISFR